jgi:hypothetical protein
MTWPREKTPKQGKTERVPTISIIVQMVSPATTGGGERHSPWLPRTEAQGDTWRDGCGERLTVGSARDHRLGARVAVLGVDRRAGAVEQLDVLGRQLEGRAFDEAAYLLARRVAEHKAKIDVEVVAVRIEHQIAVVPIAQHEHPHDH